MKPRTTTARRVIVLLGLSASLAAAQSRPTPALGPVDGQGLAPLDTGRVRVGTLAPDFALESLHGDVVRLSALRGKKVVALVFYRGHW